MLLNMPVTLCSEDWICWLWSLGMRVLRLPTKIRDAMLASVNKILYLIVHCICIHLSYRIWGTNLTAYYKPISSNNIVSQHLLKLAGVVCTRSSCTHEVERSHENLPASNHTWLGCSIRRDIDRKTVLIFSSLYCDRYLEQERMQRGFSLIHGELIEWLWFSVSGSWVMGGYFD